MQSGTLEVFFGPLPPASLQGIRSMTFIMTGTLSCSWAGFPIALFLVGRWGCLRGTTAVPRLFLLSSMLKKEELKQSFLWPDALCVTNQQESLAEPHLFS